MSFRLVCLTGLENSLPYLAEHNLTMAGYNYSDVYRDAFISGMMDVSFLGVSVSHCI